MKILLIVLLVVFALVALVALCIWGIVTHRRYTRYSEREVASDLDISTDWVELTPTPPLKATKLVQHLTILVSGYERKIGDHRNQLPLPDGTTADPEVVLVDVDGESFRLHPSMLAQRGVGYTGGREFRSRPPGSKIYTTVRIRSDKPFRASKVMWENMNLK